MENQENQVKCKMGKFVNSVNNLSGKEWLRNSVNYWFFNDDSIDKIYNRFKSFCHKKGRAIKNIDEIIVQKTAFSFNYVQKFSDLNKFINLVMLGEYNSYHILFTEKEVINSILIENYVYKALVDVNIEYRGKIIIDINNHSKIKYAFLFLNRNKEENSKYVEYKYDKKEKIANVNKTPKVIESKSKIDRIGLKHPAPYSYIDIEKLCDYENITNKVVLDPFLGVGSTFLATYKTNQNIGIELNTEYISMLKDRFKELNFEGLSIQDMKIINGDCLSEITHINKKIDVVITSPPYFSILKNNTKGIRTDKSQSRQGIVHYSESEKDFENFYSYSDYIKKIGDLFEKILKKKNNELSAYIVISDFTVDKKEKNVHGDLIEELSKRGYNYCGTDYILQNQKSIYPFGYPYKIVLNHIYQYIIKFRG